MEEILISIILPVYNVEKYLETCIESLTQGNDLSGVEIILVDDGSTDNSGEICEKTSNIYKSIVVFHKTNGGLSDARNFGLMRANGKYVVFVDSDDFLSSNAVNIMLDTVKRVESTVYVWDSYVVDEEGKNTLETKYKFNHPGIDADVHYSGEDYILRQLNINNDYTTTVWLGMYERKFLIDNNLWFKKGILHEDELWSPLVFLKAKDIYYIKEPLYRYRIRNNSIMRKNDKDYSKNLKDIVYIYSVLPAYFNHEIEDLHLKQMIKANNSKRYLHSIAKYDAYKYKEIIKDISRIEILKNARGIKDRIRSCLLLINISLYCKLTKRK